MKKDSQSKNYKTEIEFIKNTLNSVNEQPESAPSLSEIRKLVHFEVAKKEHKQKKAFYFFVAGACTTVTAIVLFTIKDPTIFVKLQLGSLLAIPLAIFKFGNKVGTE